MGLARRIPRIAFVFTALSVAFMVSAMAAFGATRVVKQDGSTPYTTIQSVLSISGKNDIVEIQDNGTYPEILTFPTTNITLRAASGSTPTIRNTGDPARNNYVNAQPAGTAISGIRFTFTGAERADCIVILGGTNTTVTDCEMEGPGTTTTTLRGVANIKTLTRVKISGYRLGALYDLTGLAAAVTDCDIHDNETQVFVSLPSVTIAGSVLRRSVEGVNVRQVGGVLTLTGTRIEESFLAGIGIDGGTLSLSRCIVKGPSATEPCLDSLDAARGPVSIGIDHCDFVGGASEFAILSTDPDAVVNLTNSIVTGSKGLSAQGGAQLTSNYNDIYCSTSRYLGVSPGANDLNVDPQYIQNGNPDGAGYFELQPYSPCGAADNGGGPLGSQGVQASPVQSLTVGVYYYPWYTTNFHGRQYLRQHLVPPQLPELGEYSDRNQAVISQHLAWSRYAGINLWVSSWWGPGSSTDVTLRDTILQNPNLGNMKFAIHYETSGRTSNYTDYTRVGPDLTYIADTYFSHPNYYKIDGKPVVVVYLTRVLSSNGTLQSTVQTMRDAAQARGFQVYILGDQAFSSNPSGAASSDTAYLDGITNYDVYGSMGATLYPGQSRINSYFAGQDKWKQVASGFGKGYVPAISPGFNDRGVRPGHVPLSRRITSTDAEGSVFQETLRQALTRLDPAAGNLLLINSWNEWHEDSQIEPVASAPQTNVDDCVTTPNYYANGLYYTGYGTLYLDLLRNSLPVSFSVESDYGNPNPEGVTHYDPNTVITASVEATVDAGAGVRRVCTGWLGSGSVPTSGTTTSVQFALTVNSSIKWLWKTQYRLAVSSLYGNPVPSRGDTYFDAGASLTAQVEASVIGDGDVTYTCTGWSGEGCVPPTGESNSVQIQMDAPGAIAWNWGSTSSIPSGWQFY